MFFWVWKVAVCGQQEHLNVRTWILRLGGIRNLFDTPKILTHVVFLLPDSGLTVTYSQASWARGFFGQGFGALFVCRRPLGLGFQ